MFQINQNGATIGQQIIGDGLTINNGKVQQSFVNYIFSNKWNAEFLVARVRELVGTEGYATSVSPMNNDNSVKIMSLSGNRTGSSGVSGDFEYRDFDGLTCLPVRSLGAGLEKLAEKLVPGSIVVFEKNETTGSSRQYWMEKTIRSISLDDYIKEPLEGFIASKVSSIEKLVVTLRDLDKSNQDNQSSPNSVIDYAFTKYINKFGRELRGLKQIEISGLEGKYPKVQKDEFFYYDFGNGLACFPFENSQERLQYFVNKFNDNECIVFESGSGNYIKFQPRDGDLRYSKIGGEVENLEEYIFSQDSLKELDSELQEARKANFPNRVQEGDVLAHQKFELNFENGVYIRVEMKPTPEQLYIDSKSREDYRRPMGLSDVFIFDVEREDYLTYEFLDHIGVDYQLSNSTSFKFTADQVAQAISFAQSWKPTGSSGTTINSFKK